MKWMMKLLSTSLKVSSLSEIEESLLTVKNESYTSKGVKENSNGCL